MAETKLVVPDGMFVAAHEAHCAHNEGCASDGVLTASIVEAALHWWSNNPIVPNDEQVESMTYGIRGLGGFARIAVKQGAIEFQRRVFFVPCPLEERVTVEKSVHGPSLWIVLRDGWNSSHIPGFKDKKDAEIYRLGLIQTLKEEKGAK